MFSLERGGCESEEKRISGVLSQVGRRLEAGEITSKEALRELAESGLFIFHGTGLNVDEVVPKKPKYCIDTKTRELKDEPEAIYGSPNPEYATFMAIISNIPGRAAVRVRNDKYSYEMSPLKRQNLGEGKGLVYVFDKSDFEERNPSEFVSFKPLKPSLKTAVDKELLPENVGEIEDI